jgi:hypothetical protein
MTLLGYERGESAATFPIMFRAELDRLLALASERGVADDPLIRQRLAWCHSKVEIMRYLGMRTLSKFLAGGHPGPDASIFKLYWSEYHKIVTELGIDILGADALVPSGRVPATAFQTDDVGAPNSSGSWVGTFYNARAGTIYAGTSQVQRNILARWCSGCPRSRVPRRARGASCSRRSRNRRPDVGRAGGRRGRGASAPVADRRAAAVRARPTRLVAGRAVPPSTRPVLPPLPVADDVRRQRSARHGRRAAGA